MKITSRILMTLVSLGVAHAAMAEEEPALAEQQEPGRWHFSAGARLAPGVKTKAAISSRAAIDAAGRLGGGASTSTKRSATTSRSESSESQSIPANEPLEFAGGFIDMNDDTVDPNETYAWHFDSSASFDDATGTFTVPLSSSATASRTSSTRRSEEILPDAASSGRDDLWGGDVEIGYDFYQGERCSLGLALGATFYRCENAIRQKSAAGSATTTSTSVGTTDNTAEALVIQDDNLVGTLGDLQNEDLSYGAGDPTGYSNPYGGGNPTLTFSDGSVTRTKSVESSQDATTRTMRRTIDVTAEGDVETQEIRLALQPAWKATDWLELRGALGAVATRVSVDADATILVSGARSTAISGDDSDWVFAGLCGLDAVVSPLDWLSLFVGADLRLGDNRMDYEAGLVKGEVELARATYRAGVCVRF